MKRNKDKIEKRKIRERTGENETEKKIREKNNEKEASPSKFTVVEESVAECC